MHFSFPVEVHVEGLGAHDGFGVAGEGLEGGDFSILVDVDFGHGLGFGLRDSDVDERVLSLERQGSDEAVNSGGETGRR